MDATQKKLIKRVSDIHEWTEAYSRLVDLDVKYFTLSINTTDKKMRKKYRDISDQYHEAIKKLTERLP